MNDKILEALQTLAAKLGVTAEHLWGVLVKQAPIDGTIELIMCSILVWFNVKMVRMVVRKTLSDKPEWKGSNSEISFVLLELFVMPWSPTKEQSVSFWCPTCKQQRMRSREDGKCPFCREPEKNTEQAPMIDLLKRTLEFVRAGG